MSHDTLTAVIGAVAAIGGAFLKGVWDWSRGRAVSTASVQTARIEDAADMRAELWAEVNKLRERVTFVEQELDKSRRGYLELLAEHTSLKAEHKSLKHEHDALLIRYADLERRLDSQ